MLYQLQALGMDALQPLNQMAKASRHLWSHPFNPWSGSHLAQRMTAGLELFERMTTVYERPEWGYETVTVGDQQVPIRQEVVQRRAWCDLVHFRKEGDWQQPRVLVVAPMSGHFPTLLRGHIEFFLPDHDVHVTDWQNARDVALSDGAFGFDDYVEYIIEFLRFLGPNTHVIAVCQPGVPALMATALMGMANDVAAPASLTLIAAPIDTRSNPTEVNDYARGRDYEWFERNVIYNVPYGFKGQGQRVYPGFIQLSGFLSMNMDSHIRKHYKFYEDLMKDDGDSAEEHRKFYNEYLAVMDMSAPFYLETIKRVFIEHHLPRRMVHCRETAIDLDAVRRTALLTIEGGKDDITGAGQTHAAQDLCRKLASTKRRQHTEPLVGHYGAFNGGYFRDNIGPMISAFMHEHDLEHDRKF